MSFSAGKGGIFDQVNRFYSNGNSVLVEQSPSINDDSHKQSSLSNPHTQENSNIGFKSPTENVDNANFNSIFNDLTKYNSPGSPYMQNLNHIAPMGKNHLNDRHEHPSMASSDNNELQNHQHLMTHDNEFNVYLDSFGDANSHQIAQDIGFKSQQSDMSFPDNTTGSNNINHLHGRKLSQDVTKYSPGVSPTVEATQPPQYTPYLQARNSRYSSKSSNTGKKVVKYSPNMKPIGTEKRNSYKVILPSNSMSSTSQSSSYEKRQPSGNGVYLQDQNNSDISTENRSYTISDNHIQRTTSNSSAYVDEKKVLRATQSPVIKPMKKRLSNANLTVNKEFSLDGSNQHLSPEMGKLKKTVSMTMYNQVLDGNDPLAPATSDNLPELFVKNNKKSGSAVGHRTAKKKEVHKEAEKHRRERLNIALEDLNDIIPPEMKEKDRFPSKASTVEHAAEYIRFLINELNQRSIPINFTIPEETYNPKERKESI